jgi:hypothetical protein
MSSDGNPDSIRNPKPTIRNRRWVWFFAALVVLSAAAAAVNWTYNTRQQLTPEKLAAAEALWDKNGPADYDLVVEKAINSAADVPEVRDRIEVQVRGKKVVSGTINGAPLAERLLAEYDMPGWFGFVEDFLRIDTAPGARRTFRAAEFDPQTGQLLRFRRRVSGTHERQEIVLRLTPPAEMTKSQ